MTQTQTLQQLRQLKLSGMAEALSRQLEQTSTYDSLSFIERMQLLLDEENLTRKNRKQDRLIRQARFKLKASIQDVDYQHPRNISQSQIAQLDQQGTEPVDHRSLWQWQNLSGLLIVMT